MMLFFSFKSRGDKSVVSIELRNSGINSIPSFCYCFKESFILLDMFLPGLVLILSCDPQILFTICFDYFCTVCFGRLSSKGKFLCPTFSIGLFVMLVVACLPDTDDGALYVHASLHQMFNHAFCFSCSDTSKIISNFT